MRSFLNLFSYAETETPPKRSLNTVEKVFHTREVIATLVPYLELSDIPNIARVTKGAGFVIHTLNASDKFKKNYGLDTKIKSAISQDAKTIIDNKIDSDDTKLKTAIQHIAEGKSTPEELKLVTSKKIQFKSETEETCTEISKGGAKMTFDLMDYFIKRKSGRSSTSDVRIELAIYSILLIASGATYVGGQIYYFYENYQKSQVHNRLIKRAKILENMESALIKEEHPENKEEPSRAKPSGGP